jgi:two-component system sensor histidine kinase RegB
MAFDLEPAITLPWLIRLRWLFVAGQLVAWPLAHWGLGAELPWWPFAIAGGVIGGSNAAVAVAARRASRFPAQIIGCVLILDTVLLTAQLAALGGATNPFSVLYLVYITLSSVVLSARWTLAIAALAIAGFALLFLVPAEASHAHHAGAPALGGHLQGMWAAFVLAAALTAFFVRRISATIASQREQIATLRETAARHARLASLATLAAGAAHELNSPLSTIAVAAHEASLRAGQLVESAAEAGAGAADRSRAVAADLALILEEVDRCQQILHRLAARATEADAIEPVTVGALVASIRDQLGERGARLEVRAEDDPFELALPPAQMVQSLVALIRNALDASGPADRVVLEIRRDATAVSIVVEDRGAGIPASVLAKVGEPFFTTKQPGHGMGLGVFLARVFFESRGGALSIESTPGAGTRARVRLPITPGADAPVPLAQGST